MKLLVVDDSLGNPAIVRQLLREIPVLERVEVVSSPKDLAPQMQADLIVLGGRCLNRAQELRRLFPNAYIIGRSPWFEDGPLSFYPWGNELRDPTLPLDSLALEFLAAQDGLPPT